MTSLVSDFDPLGLPVPVPILFILKVFGFFLHVLFMNLWVAGIPIALVLWKLKPQVANRLFQAMPFAMAFGINAGIVPLLFLQTLYPQFFYPATILQAWFWFMVIPLLLIAYYAVYLVAYGRLRILAGSIAFILLTWIGLTFSSAMSLTAAPERWSEIFLSTTHAGAVHGGFFALSLETFLRYGLILGMAFGTVSAFLALDSQWFARAPGYQNQTRNLIPILYLVGLAIYGISGVFYAPMVMDKIPGIWRILTVGSMPVAAMGALTYWRQPKTLVASALIGLHGFVLLSNAITRQIVQARTLHQWFDLQKVPVHNEWGSVGLFIVTLLSGMGALTWMGVTILRRLKPSNSLSRE